MSVFLRPLSLLLALAISGMALTAQPKAIPLPAEPGYYALTAGGPGKEEVSATLRRGDHEPASLVLRVPDSAREENQPPRVAYFYLAGENTEGEILLEGTDEASLSVEPVDPAGMQLDEFFYMAYFARESYAPRRFFGAPLEPEHHVLSGAGQDPQGFRDFAAAVGPRNTPALYMMYTKPQPERVERFARELAEARAVFDDLGVADPILQIGFAITYDGQPDKVFTEAIAAGQYDEEIDAFIDLLREAELPAMIRIGYEFNGSWNGYPPESYKRAYIRVARKLRASGLPVALVWCASADDTAKAYMDWYPGNEWVDWWAIDLFSAQSLTHPFTHHFLDGALLHGKPVLIGESAPRSVGTLRGEESWEEWFAPYFELIRTRSHIKGFCYINWDWAQWARRLGTNWGNWGDSRIEENETVARQFAREMNLPLYRHAEKTEPAADEVPAGTP